MRLILQFLVLAAVIVGFLVIGEAWHHSTNLLQPEYEECPLEKKGTCAKPSDFQLRYRNIAFKTEDQLKISGWYVSGLRGYPAIIMVHGMGSSRHVGLHYAGFLREQGYHLLMFDLRNHGKSEVSFSSMGMSERKDVHGAVTFLRKKRDVGNIGVLGFGTGASTAIMAMAENPYIKAGVFEGGYAEIDDFISQGLSDQNGNVSFIPNWLIIRLFKLRLRDSVAVEEPGMVIPKISPRAVFIIHGTRNTVIPFEHAKTLYLSARHPKRIWPVLKGDGTTAILIDRHRTEQELINFFYRYL